MDWLEFWKFFGGTAAAIAGVAWLVRSLVAHLLSKDVETFKKDLERQAFEHQVKYRRVYDLVADNVAEVYARLLRLCQAVQPYVKVVEIDPLPKEEQLERVDEANTELQKCLLPNRIHLPPGLYERTKELAGWLCDIANDITNARRLKRDSEKRGVGDKQRNEMNERARKLWRQAEEDFKNAMYLLDALVADYQKRLGIYDEPDYKPTRAKLEVTAHVTPARVTGTVPPIAAVARTETASTAAAEQLPTSPPPQAAPQTPDATDQATGQSPPANA